MRFTVRGCANCRRSISATTCPQTLSDGRRRRWRTSGTHGWNTSRRSASANCPRKNPSPASPPPKRLPLRRFLSPAGATPFASRVTREARKRSFPRPHRVLGGALSAGAPQGPGDSQRQRDVLKLVRQGLLRCWLSVRSPSQSRDWLLLTTKN